LALIKLCKLRPKLIEQIDPRKSEDRVLGREIEEWRPKFGNLRNMAEKLVQIFVGQKNDVEPEMENLGQRWVGVKGLFKVAGGSMLWSSFSSDEIGVFL
jgi:hypothetical protein